MNPQSEIAKKGLERLEKIMKGVDPDHEEEEESLSQYDVSRFTASQLFERVNLPDNLSQYDNACLNPVLDTSELADTNHFEGS